MDRYAHRLHDWLESSEFGFHVRLAAHIGALTRDSVGDRAPTRKRRNSREAFVRWWTQPVDPSRVVLPGPLHGPQQWAARYYFYPWRVKREAKRADLVHVLDHSYAHMIETAGRCPVVVTVHDLMPVVVLRSPTETWREGWREGVRTRFLRQALKALRQADAYIVGTHWLKHELATWLGNDKNIFVVPFGVDRAFYGESTVARERGRRGRGGRRPRSGRLHACDRAPRRSRRARRADPARLGARAPVYVAEDRAVDRGGVQTPVLGIAPAPLWRLLFRGCRPSRQHLTNQFDILLVLRPPSRLFRPHDVLEPSSEKVIAVDGEMDRVAREVLVACRARGLECQVQPSRFRHQVPHIRPRQHLRTAIESQPLGYCVRVDTSIELAQCSGQTLQVAGVARRGDVGVVCGSREALEARRESANQHEVHAVTDQGGEELLEIERRDGRNGLRHVAPDARTCSRSRPPAGAAPGSSRGCGAHHPACATPRRPAARAAPRGRSPQPRAGA